MTKWIKIDKESFEDDTVGTTYVMDIPGGLIVKNVGAGGSTMVFVPIEDTYPNQQTKNFWIKENKII